MAQSVHEVVAKAVPLPDLSVSKRWLPEGLQVVTRNGESYLAGVLIQFGKECSQGGLFFYHPRTDSLRVVESSGRPGMFRPVENHEDLFLVAQDNEVGFLKIDRNWSGLFERRWKAPPEFADGKIIMANDGFVINPSGPAGESQVVVGFKDFHFRSEENLGCVCQFSGPGQRRLWADETCPNGNAFIRSKENPTLLHIDTARQSIRAVPYDPDTNRVGQPRDVFSFADGSAIPPPYFHPALYPDGLVFWHTPQGKTKMIVAIFDNRPESEFGQAFQLDITDGNFSLECVYTLPGSPRVTSVALAMIEGKPEVWFTTASEGLLEARNTADPLIGALYRASAEHTGLTDSIPALEKFRLN